MLASLFVVVLGLCYCSSQNITLDRPLLEGPSEALIKKAVEFGCHVPNHPKNESILMQIYKEGNHSKVFGETTSLQGEVAVIPMVITRSHGGYLECVAKAQNNSEILPSVSNPHYLKVVEPVKNAKISSSSPVEVFEGKKLDLRCQISAGTDVSYKWLRDGLLISESDQLKISRVTPKDSGSYMCMATNVFNKTQVFTSNSSEVVVKVKESGPKPNIAYTVLKDDDLNYYAMVTCYLTKGPVPVTFVLYNRTIRLSILRVNERHTTFKVPLDIGQELMLRCMTVSGNFGNLSGITQWLPITVVPVHGPVMMHYDYNIGENKALVMRFYCKAANGSHPRYQWFLNETLLPNEGSFYHVVDHSPEQSILELEKKKPGKYHCKVSDSFDITNAISSKRYYIKEEVPKHLPVFVVAVVFGCFAFEILLVSACCWIGAVCRRRQFGEKSLWSLEMKRRAAAYEGELDLSVYEEDPDGVKSAREDEFDQTSEASVDEWPEIEREKKTLEDEPV